MSNPKYVELPVLALRGQVVFPNMVQHFDVGRKKSLLALEQAMEAKQLIFLVGQKRDGDEDPQAEDLCPVGTIATIRQVMNLPGENARVLVEGECRGVMESVTATEPCMVGSIRVCKDKALHSQAAQATVRGAQDLLRDYTEKSQRMAPDVVNAIRQMEKPGELADSLASNVLTKLEEKEEMLEELDPLTRLEKMCGILMRETNLADMQKQIMASIQQTVEKNQKDYYLREQIHAIQKELGDGDEVIQSEYRKRLEKEPLSEEARERCAKELDRLERMQPGSPEASMCETYIEWILDLPWGKETQDHLELDTARQVLDREHYGLDKVKERIIEYLAVLKLKNDMKGPILCFVGPPGVGKTSIVRAIAEAVGRKFVQMSLGGVRDEAEIRGHRRTYLGSIPGRIISGLKQAGSMNPVFLFDEIDKMGSDSRGDPASAMLEVLDAEQNHAFRDHYLELAFDLSKVMFITTANSTETIPAPLLDRMELIEVPSYTEEEKLEILTRHLLPKQIQAHGLKPEQLQTDENVRRKLIEGYTREAGVRTLERVSAKVCRKAAVLMQDLHLEQVLVDEARMHDFLGAFRYTREDVEKEAILGVVNGLAWTSVGGEILQAECTIMPGKGELKLTGKLGDVMKESAEAGFSYVRAHWEELGLRQDFYKETDVHIHMPEGAVPKDGPSAGVTMITAMVSVLSKRKVRQDVAMTGEITLRGRVLPIGGLKEKTLAAYRAGIKQLIIPQENHKDLEEIPSYVLKSFKITEVTQVSQVLAEVLL